MEYVKNSFNKLIGILLSVLMTSILIPLLPVEAATNRFQDVEEKDWFYDAVTYVNNDGLMNGTSGTFFEPQTTMSRAMVVTVLHRIEGVPAAIPSTFKDVPAGTWYTDAVAWAAANGIVNGYDQNTFCPFNDVTREQIALILFRYADKKGYDVSKRGDLKKYEDSSDASDWAKDAMAWANTEGLIVGLDHTTIAPKANATRAQVATIFMRFCEKYRRQNPEEHNDSYIERNNDPGKTDIKTYTVIFDYNYGNQGTIRIVEVNEGEKVNSTDQPERNGYRFIGWYTASSGGVKYDQAVNGNITLYAHWTKNATGGSGSTTPITKTYAVRFETNGGSEIPDQALREGQTVTKPDDPAREGLCFAGWYSDNELTTRYRFDQKVSDNLVLYAKWVRKDLSFTDFLIEQMPKDKNWTVSPYSLEMCLAMVANGAKGRTQEEILAALQISDLEIYNTEVRELLGTYDSFNRVMKLETANSLWINQDRFLGKGAFLQSFRDILSLNYLAEAKEVRDINSVEEINAWANDKTHGKISRIIDENKRQFAVALANAVYFKAAWQNQFSSDLTKRQTFYNQDGTEAETLFMYQMNDFPYYEADGIQVVEMPYQNCLVDETGWRNMQFFNDADFGMYLLMSDKELDLQDFLDHTGFHREKVRLTVPRFKMEYGDSLVDELKALGVLTVFDPYQADLSGTIDDSDFPGMNSLYLDEVVQKAYLAIDEEGTEAAAVTVAIEKNTAVLDPPPIYDFTADRPFYFVIRDNNSGRILFAGKYNQVSG